NRRRGEARSTRKLPEGIANIFDKLHSSPSLFLFRRCPGRFVSNNLRGWPCSILRLLMPVMICMLRGVNVGGHNKISMETLRGICASLKFQDARTYVQSGNVVFRTDQRSEARVAASLESAIEKKLGFRPAVVVRKAADFRAVIAANPFRARKDIHPGKLLVSFLSARPTADAWAELRKIKADPEELRIADRELYIY